MDDTLEIVIWRQGGLNASLNLSLLVSLSAVASLVVKKTLQALLHLSPREANPVQVLLLFTLLALSGYASMLRAQGKLKIADGSLTASVLLRTSKAFDLASTQISVEAFRATGRGHIVGPMLVLRQGSREFRVGCLEHYLGRAAYDAHERQDRPLRFTHVRITLPDFLTLAQALHVTVPRPAGWQPAPQPVI